MCRRCGEPDRRGPARARRRRRAVLWAEWSIKGWIPCAWCVRKMRPSQFEVDRVLPGCCGGTYRRDNIVPSCPPCNKARALEHALEVHQDEGCDQDWWTMNRVERLDAGSKPGDANEIAA